MQVEREQGEGERDGDHIAFSLLLTVGWSLIKK